MFSDLKSEILVEGEHLSRVFFLVLLFVVFQNFRSLNFPLSRNLNNPTKKWIVI
jgi:hypothetical protein